MAGNQPDQWEKTEDATPQKRKDAKQKGSVAKSQDINSLMALGVSLIILLAIGETLAYSLLDICRQIFIDSYQVNFAIPQFFSWVKTLLQNAIWIAMPILSCLMLIGIVVNFMQVGAVFTFHPLKPDIEKLNLVAGFKRLFSMKLLFETFKTLLKTTLFFFILYSVISALLPKIPSLAHSAPQQLLPYLIEHSAQLVFFLLLIYAFMALLDNLFVRWDFNRNLKMTKKEMKDEIKRREGDPHIKSKRKELEQELRNRSGSLASVKDADVIITNPTHYAIVIRYERGVMPAPKVTGKGMDEMARAIRQEAQRVGVPIIESPSLARHLFRKSKIKQYIPEDTFLLVAKVLRQAYQKRQRPRSPYGVA